MPPICKNTRWAVDDLYACMIYRASCQKVRFNTKKIVHDK